MITEQDRNAQAALLAADICPLVDVIDLQEEIFENTTSSERKFLLKGMKKPLDLVVKSSKSYLKKSQQIQKRKVNINQNFFFRTVSTKKLGEMNYKVVKTAQQMMNQTLSMESPGSSVCIQAGVFSTLASYSQRNCDTVYMLQKKEQHTEKEAQEMKQATLNMLQVKKDIKTYRKMIKQR